MAVDQEGYLWRNDDGNESSATSLAAQDAPVLRQKSQTTRLRILLNTTGDLPSSSFQLEFRRVGETTWKKIDAG